MKKLIILYIVVLMFSFSVMTYADETEAIYIPTSDQTASAILDQGENEIEVTVDLSDGWSVEFAPGAVYLYEGRISEDSELSALGVTLDEEIFNEYLEFALDQDSYKEYAHCFSYVDEFGYTSYFYKIETDAYFMITVFPEEDPLEISARFSMKPAVKPSFNFDFSMETETEK